MACGKDHKEMGIACGLLAAAWAQPPDFQGALALAELVGGGIGGAGGAALPDLLEPATSSYHRKFFHAVMPAGVSAHQGITPLLRVQADLRTRALELIKEGKQEVDPHRRLGLFIQAMLLAALGGAVVGMAAGYASHLALDAMTPRGLPIFY